MDWSKNCVKLFCLRLELEQIGAPHATWRCWTNQRLPCQCEGRLCGRYCSTIFQKDIHGKSRMKSWFTWLLQVWKNRSNLIIQRCIQNFSKRLKSSTNLSGSSCFQFAKQKLACPMTGSIPSVLDTPTHGTATCSGSIGVTSASPFTQTTPWAMYERKTCAQRRSLSSCSCEWSNSCSCRSRRSCDDHMTNHKSDDNHVICGMFTSFTSWRNCLFWISFGSSVARRFQGSKYLGNRVYTKDNYVYVDF